MFRSRAPLALAGLLALSLAACSSSQPTPSPAATPSPPPASPSTAVASGMATNGPGESATAGLLSSSSPQAAGSTVPAATSPAPSVAPTPASVSAQPSIPPSVEPSLPENPSFIPQGATPAPSAHTSGVTDLRTLLPDSLGGHALTKSVVTGQELSQNPTSVSQELRDTLTKLNKQVTDLTLASAIDMSGKTDAAVSALRIAGVKATAFLNAYEPYLTKVAPEGTVVDTEMIAGKQALHVSMPAGQYSELYLVARDDVLFMVASKNFALVNEAVSKLP